jgi:hypothetical protein
MFETIVVLTYVYSEPSTDKVYLLCDITLYNANGLKISLKYANLSLFHFKEDKCNIIHPNSTFISVAPLQLLFYLKQSVTVTCFFHKTDQFVTDFCTVVTEFHTAVYD